MIISDEMKLEIKSGVNFITHLLRVGSKRKISEQKLKQFSNCLYEILLKRYEMYWCPDRPYMYSGYRVLRINHHMDPLIQLAGEQCGLSQNFLNTTLPSLEIWIDPFEVTYRFQHDSKLILIYKYKECDSEPWSPQALKKKTCSCCCIL